MSCDIKILYYVGKKDLFFEYLVISRFCTMLVKKICCLNILWYQDFVLCSKKRFVVWISCDIKILYYVGKKDLLFLNILWYQDFVLCWKKDLLFEYLVISRFFTMLEKKICCLNILWYKDFVRCWKKKHSESLQFLDPFWWVHYSQSNEFCSYPKFCQTRKVLQSSKRVYYGCIVDDRFFI